MKMLIALVMAGTSLIHAGQSPRPTLTDLAWMAGSWSGVAGGVEMEEHWSAPKANSMIGMHRDVGKGRTLLFEFIRIEQQGAQIVYLAMPNGRSPATAFPLKESSANRVVFENPTHDFPQRVIYWKDGNDLRARVEGTANGKPGSQEWRWSPGALK
jgi:hypothetical protein